MSSTEFAIEVEERLGSVLSDAGFNGAELRWVRLRGPYIDCVDIQVRSDDAACCVNLGEHLSFLPVVGGSTPVDIENMSSVECEIKQRLAPEGEPEHWWEVGVESSVDDLINCFRSSGEAFFQKYNDFPNPFIGIETSDIESDATLELMPMMTKVRRILLIARIYDYLNDAANATAWAEFGKKNAGMAVGPKAAFREILRKYK